FGFAHSYPISKKKALSNLGVPIKRGPMQAAAYYYIDPLGRELRELAKGIFMTSTD
ncbi:hypothetical protein E4U52_004640, partial [Claviceps spartinae]